ncbi:hypothetical protein PBY51_013103 [Eleginops maclovinus]|uniref:Uncharacterized protein n=2 Tax=Eleginops maclovinus TaxID=56733 RepID=A0AAN7Y6Y8_ELEMC|nr:hypothetical protein PBY51_013103 [Eleginops maclovinus]
MEIIPTEAISSKTETVADMRSMSSIDSFITCATDFPESSRFSHIPSILGRVSTNPSLEPTLENEHEGSQGNNTPVTGRGSKLGPYSDRPRALHSNNPLKSHSLNVNFRAGEDSGTGALSDSSVQSHEASAYTTARSRTPSKSPENVLPNSLFTFHDASVNKFIDADTDEEEHMNEGSGNNTSQRLMEKASHHSSFQQGPNHTEGLQRRLGNRKLPLEGQENHVAQELQPLQGENSHSKA